MPHRRCKELGRAAVYHLTSRTAGQLHLFDEQAKGKFVNLMWDAAHFCGMELISYCVMTNHFHILLRCPNPSDPPADETFLARVKLLYPPAHVFNTLAREWVDQKNAAPPDTGKKKRRGRPTVAARTAKRLLKRMGDISVFMKELKQAFSVWFNREHDRRGTLWEGRFVSNLIEDTPKHLRAVSAYDDLNPVRAGIVTDPAEYIFSSYSSAVAGNQEIRKAIISICGPEGTTWETAAPEYRKLIYITGGTAHQAGKVTLTPEAIKAVLDAGGKLTLAEVLRIRIRHMTHGFAMGSREYLEGVFKRHRPFFGKKRLTCARKMQGVPCEELTNDTMVARDLRM